MFSITPLNSQQGLAKPPPENKWSFRTFVQCIEKKNIYGPQMGKNIYGPPIAKNVYGLPMAKNIYGPPMAKNTFSSHYSKYLCSIQDEKG